MVPMSAPANTPGDADDATALAQHANALAHAVDATIAGWAARCVTTRWEQWRGEPVPEDVEAAAARAGEQARAQVMPALLELLHADVDAQRSNPLSILRDAVSHPTAVLHTLCVPPVVRDEQAERMFPEDPYDLTPAAFADIDPSVHEPGLVWGAAKAHVVLSRRRTRP
jgi:hypothetical protein